MNIVDAEVTGVMVEHDGEHYLRLTAPTQQEEAQRYGHPEFIWYRMDILRWTVLMPGEQSDLEGVYQKLGGETMQ